MMGLAGVENAYIGGSSLLIVVSVALETMKQIEAQLVMRHYQGFMRSLGEPRGRAEDRAVSASGGRRSSRVPSRARFGESEVRGCTSF